jgi:ubiquinone/menaquinone biosynthesis C-methylase UbiE
MKKQDIIAQARQGFDNRLHTEEYHKIHSDQAHLKALMEFLEVRPARKYLDLGTGNGYLAFEMARRFPEIFVTGVDIATNAIHQDQALVQERQIGNLEFLEYDGGRLPLEDDFCWGCISRYAFHHFPDAASSAGELGRVTQSHGFVIIADPIMYDEDTSGFIDRLQQLKPDGHVHYYRMQELDDVFRQAGFSRQAQFLTKLTYPREMNADYRRLFEQTPAAVLGRYQIAIGDPLVQITVTIRNVMYRKS